jgi:hypothetical protein
LLEGKNREAIPFTNPGLNKGAAMLAMPRLGAAIPP